MGTPDEITRSMRVATAAGLCGYQVGRASTAAIACRERAKYEVRSEHSPTGRYLLCTRHARRVEKWGGTVVSPIENINNEDKAE